MFFPDRWETDAEIERLRAQGAELVEGSYRRLGEIMVKSTIEEMVERGMLPRAQEVERLEAMCGRDEGGIIPPPAGVQIDHSPISWWKTRTWP